MLRSRSCSPSASPSKRLLAPFVSTTVLPAGLRRTHDTTRFECSGSWFAVGSRSGHLHLAWRVVSADSHPFSGAFVFHIGKPGVGAAGVVGHVLDEEPGSQTVDRAFWLVRFLSLTLIMPVSAGQRRLRSCWLGRPSRCADRCGSSSHPSQAGSPCSGCGYRARGRARKRAGDRRGPASIADRRRPRHSLRPRMAVACLARGASRVRGGDCRAPDGARRRVSRCGCMWARGTDRGHTGHLRTRTRGGRSRTYERLGARRCSLRLGGWTGVPLDRPVASSKRGALAIHSEGGSAVLCARCRLHRGTPDSGCHQRFLRGWLVARPLGDDVRPTLARQGGTRSTGARTRCVQQPRFRPAPSSQDCLGARTKAVSDVGCRRARPRCRHRRRTAALVAEPPAKAQLVGGDRSRLT